MDQKHGALKIISCILLSIKKFFYSCFSLFNSMSSIFLGKVIGFYHTVFLNCLQSFIARTCYITHKPN